MRTNNLLRILAILSLLTFACAAFAGGPLIINPDTKTAYHYGPGTVSVYYDNGNLATNIPNWSTYPETYVTLDNSVGKHLVEKGYADWSAIPSSSFRAAVVGNFASLGLPDINGSNAQLVIGTFNGGGVDVIFDADGTILSDFFGVSPNVLGISSPEFGEEGTSIITESWTVLSGQAIDPADTNAENYQGVATHEFGHSIGLAHTQTNGAAYFYGYWGENVGPGTCTNLPYATDLTKDDVETMYPYSDPWVGGTGLAQANIHTTDDIAALSDLYPGPGWPAAYGTIQGKIYDTDGKTQLTGVNVIARELTNPYGGGNSTMSGEWTQGMFGPDGSYILHGLKPGAQYVVYTDAIFAGGFPTPPLWFLPGPERFYNGTQPPKTDQFTSCQYKVITATAGGTTTADIQFERIKGAPVVYNLGYGTFVSDVSGDGSLAVGSYARGGPVFRWTAKAGMQLFPNVWASDANVFISKNGQFISTNLINTSNVDQGSFRWDAKNGWVPVVSNVGSCGSDSTYTWGVANDGSVYGLAYKTCNAYQGFRWNPATGMTLLPTATTKDDGTPSNSRMNRVSADGTTTVGWEETIARVTMPDWAGGGTYEWIGRVASFASKSQPAIVRNAMGDTMMEATAVSGDGKIIAGSQYSPEALANAAAWMRPIDSNQLTYIGPMTGDQSRTDPIALSKNGSVMVGFSGDPWWDWTVGPFLYTKQLGMVDLNQFMKLQGANMDTVANNLWTPMAVSDDATVIGGWAFGNLATFGWVVQMPKVFVCHMPPGNLDNGHTISVPFPTSLNDHLAHGDSVGPCQNYQP